ncbi:uncharacterized protein C8orf88 homolog isoform X2 [Pezoporus occidentalis]|uniref:uncharacterized protein C8orf88 homolog isoform X2 n=1 Tax=Pezoporus occidentalis TaxID=407982 RepID=UPI002F91442F
MSSLFRCSKLKGHAETLLGPFANAWSFLSVGRSPVGATPEQQYGLLSWYKMLRETKKFIGKSLQAARPVHHLSSKQESAIVLNFQTKLPGNTEVCLQSKVDWLPEMTEVKILTQTMMPCQPNQHESEAKKESYNTFELEGTFTGHQV